MESEHTDYQGEANVLAEAIQVADPEVVASMLSSFTMRVSSSMIGCDAMYC